MTRELSSLISNAIFMKKLESRGFADGVGPGAPGGF